MTTTDLDHAPRNLRRLVYSTERKAMATGRWGEWQRSDVRDAPGRWDGWLRTVHTAWKTLPEWLVVLVRTVETPWGSVEHAIIRTATNTELPWRAKQRIKDDLFGPERIAVEVFPASDRLVDGADLYHLWILPAGMALPFGLHGEDESR